GSVSVFGINLGVTSYGTYSPGTADEVTGATISRNTITTITTSGANSSFGIVVCPATSGTTQISNNSIAAINGNATPSNFTAGIYVGGGTGSTTQIYYNSVSMSGSGTRTSPSTALAIGGSNPIVDVKNNALYNISTASGTLSATIASYAFTTASTTFSNLSFNYNSLFTSGAYSRFAGTGSTSSPTIQADLNALNTAIGGGANSISANPLFTSTTNLIPALGTTLSGAGTPLAVLVDINDISRNATTPFIGAHEQSVDLVPPTITYTPLTNTCTPGARTITATITDTSGIPTSGVGLPVLYWKANNGSYNAVTGTNTSGDLYDFTIGTGSVAGDVISYYIAAQDNSANVNVAVSPATGASGFTTNPPAAGTPPTTPNTYTNYITLSGVYTVGTGGNYTTLTSAIAAYNSACLSGAVTFSLTDSSYSSAETFPLSINVNTYANATNTLTIKPATGIVSSISGSNATAIFNLNGVKYLTIDGSNTVGGTTKNLTISNTNTSGTTITFINEASNNNIKNSILNGVSTATTSGVILLSTTTGTDGNDNNTIQNNDISGGATATGVGITNAGTATNSTTKNSGNIISNNNIFNFSVNGIREGGGTLGTVYSGNNIYEVATQTTALTGALFRTNTLEGFTFTGNKIYDLKTSATTSVYGIDLVNMQTGSIGTITNNMISLDATTPLTVYGIFDEAGTGRLFDIYNNTIAISGTVSGASNSAAYYYSIASTTNFKNNILSNTRNGGTGKHYAFRSIATVTSLTSDYNDLYVGAGTGNVLATNTTADQTSLSTWQTATSKDTNSANVLPVFTSVTDLHIATSSVGLDNLGTPIATVTTDIDGETRNLTTPDLGADEFTIPVCVTANGGTATGSAQFCTSGTPSIAASGYSFGSGTTYQWYSSTNAADYPNAGTAISGQVNPSVLTTSAISTTSYYWLRVTCGTDSSTANSNLVTITINTPATFTASAAQSSICSGGSGTTLTASGGASYTWTSNPSGFTSTSATPSVNPSVTTTYTVNGIDTNGC
ncbi:MAG: beta strand repeat-containing protein, partial [Bacteroidia bacterium]